MEQVLSDRAVVDGERFPPIEFYQPTSRGGYKGDKVQFDGLVCARCRRLTLHGSLGMGSLDPFVLFEQFAALGWGQAFASGKQLCERRVGV
jgi:hypothetical protein